MVYGSEVRDILAGHNPDSLTCAGCSRGSENRRASSPKGTRTGTDFMVKARLQLSCLADRSRVVGHSENGHPLLSVVRASLPLKSTGLEALTQLKVAGQSAWRHMRAAPVARRFVCTEPGRLARCRSRWLARKPRGQREKACVRRWSLLAAGRCARREAAKQRGGAVCLGVNELTRLAVLIRARRRAGRGRRSRGTACAASGGHLRQTEGLPPARRASTCQRTAATHA